MYSQIISVVKIMLCWTSGICSPLHWPWLLLSTYLTAIAEFQEKLVLKLDLRRDPCHVLKYVIFLAD